MSVLTIRFMWPGPEYVANILWNGRWPMRGGLFPKGHPVGGGDIGGDPCSQYGDNPAMTAFRSRGYWASCFPEGDGITIRVPEGRTKAEVMRDITECFGWKITGGPL